MASTAANMSSKRSNQVGGQQAGPSLPTADSSVLLGALQDDVKDIRILIQCGICIKPLYEPFTLACGHTFCYSCLTQWFANSRQKKTCPDCRASVHSQPAPAYLIRQLVQMFTSREELFEKCETTTDHICGQQAETERMETDKSNKHPREGGLFQGCFNRIPPPSQPIHDTEDGVERCPRCAWELEEAECGHCGYGEGDSLFEYSDIDMDDFDDDDGMAVFGDAFDGFGAAYGDFAMNQIANGNGGRIPAFPGRGRMMGLGRRHRLGSRRLHDTDSEDESSEEESADDGEMDSFISDGDGGEDGLETDRSTVVDERSYLPEDIGDTSEIDPSMLHDEVSLNAEGPINIDDSSDAAETSSEDDENVVHSRNAAARRRYQVEAETSSEEEENVAHSRNTVARRRRQVASSSLASSDSSKSNSESDSASDSSSPINSSRHARRNQIRPACIGESSPNASHSEDESTIAPSENQHDDSETAGTSTTNAISIDDDDDSEGPIRPTRVNRVMARRAGRRANRRNRRSQELRRANTTAH